MGSWRMGRWGRAAFIATLVACNGNNKDETTGSVTDDDPTTTTEDTGETSAPAGFDIGIVQVRDADMQFVADVVQAASGGVVAVGLDHAGQGAVHLVEASGVTVLHAGPPLGNPTSVDLDASGVIFLTDAGGADGTEGEVAATDEEPTYPTGGVFQMPGGGGAPAVVTDDIVTPRGIVAAADGVLYVTGFTTDRQPAVFSVQGQAAVAFASGPPLVQPGDISVVNDPDATQLWVIDVSGGQDGVTHGGSNLVALNPPASDVIEVNEGMTATGVTGRGPDALVTTTDQNGASRIQIVDVTDGQRRDVQADNVDLSTNVTGAGAGADPTLPVWAGGSTGQVYVTLKK
ncbi:MAG: hypothetical protein KTR31_13300 [Myxococcales bacterium]|nr:hypothetical protein [Myxococcales bacterium]